MRQLQSTLSFPVFLLFLLFFGFFSQLPGQVRLYQTTRTGGLLQELNINNGSIIATNVAGISDGRGMDFSPLGGLYICESNTVQLLSTSASSTVTQVTYTGEIPHDLCFDASGNLYVATNLNVYVYSPSIVQTLTFAHGLTTVTGNGNGNKGWGIEIRPDNGEIYVVGRLGLRRFNPTTGALLGSVANSSSFGFPCLKFTSSGFNNAFLYMGSVISGVDQIRVYDTNLNLLRVFFPPHNGNPIDLEIHPSNQEIYLFNTDASNPTNRILTNETLAAGWATFANPGRGSALGDYTGIVLPEFDLGFQLKEFGEEVQLSWNHLTELPVNRYLVEREGEDGLEEMGWLDAPHKDSDKMFLWGNSPQKGINRYRLKALDVNGEVVHSEIVLLDRTDSGILALTMDHQETAWIFARDQSVLQLKIQITDLNGRMLRELTAPSEAQVDLSGLANGLYLLEAKGYDQQGKLIALKVFKIKA